MCIEVWLHQRDQFNEKEAMNGHSGYMLIEQWQIDIKLRRWLHKQLNDCADARFLVIF